jgi:predicted secreted Zn-dependent protease
MALGRDKKIANDASWKGEVSTMLKSIDNSVTGIRAELDTMDTRIREQGERLIAVESSAKQAHHRIDRLEKES